MSIDPEEWTPRRRASFQAAALKEFLAVVPTERTVYAEPETVDEREEKARQISDLMDQVWPGKS